MAKRPSSDKSGLTRRQLSRAKREARIRTAILVSTGVVAFLVIGLVIFAIVNENVIQPNRIVLTVDDAEVSVSEFQDRVEFNYYLQTGGQPIEQLGVDNTFFGELTMQSLIDELVIEQKAAELGLEISEEELQEEVELSFGFDAGEPEPTPTVLATEAVEGEPTVTPTFVFTPTPSPTPTLEPGVTPSPTPSGPPTVTPTPLPLPTPEPLTEEEFDVRVDEFLANASRATGLSEERILELIYEQVELSLLREQLLEEVELEVEESQTLVHAAHILVETQEEAEAVLERLEAGEDFAELAAEVSIDQSNAFRGGDLGWVSRGDMVEPFENALFALEEGEISEPVETQFGWHIIRVDERIEDEPLTETELVQQRREAFSELIEAWQEEADVEQTENWERFVPELP